MGAAIDLLQPGSFDPLLDAFVQAVDQEADQLGSIGGASANALRKISSREIAIGKY
jgi:hypothetical protein